MIAESVSWCSSVCVPLGAVPSCKGKRSYFDFRTNPNITFVPTPQNDPTLKQEEDLQVKRTWIANKRIDLERNENKKIFNNK